MSTLKCGRSFYKIFNAFPCVQYSSFSFTVFARLLREIEARSVSDFSTLANKLPCRYCASVNTICNKNCNLEYRMKLRHIDHPRPEKWVCYYPGMESSLYDKVSHNHHVCHTRLGRQLTELICTDICIKLSTGSYIWCNRQIRGVLDFKLCGLVTIYLFHCSTRQSINPDLNENENMSTLRGTHLVSIGIPTDDWKIFPPNSPLNLLFFF